MLRRSFLLSALACSIAARAAGPVTVFAAASLQDAMRALAPLAPAPLRLSFAASSALARQIEAGAPADLFLPADEAWMDWAEQRGLVDGASRTAALGNALVLVAGPGVPDLALADLPGTSGRVAVGDPAHVPAGRYAEAALRTLGLWEALRPRLARADNVRGALLLVERGEAPLGIVYRTDALAAAGVREVAAFPASSHPPIAYPFALTTRGAANSAAAAVLRFLLGAEAAPVWRRFGFLAAD